MEFKQKQINSWVYTGLPKSERRKVIQDFEKEKPTLQTIFTGIAAGMGLTLSELIRRRKTDDLVLGRMIGIMLALKYTECTITEIGRFLNRDHSSVIHSRETFKDLFDTNSGKLKSMLKKLDIDGKPLRFL